MAELKIEKYKKLLLEEKTVILEKLLKDSDAYDDLDSREIGDLIDQTYKYYEKEMLINMSTSDKQMLNDIEIAIGKIESKKYGECEQCSKKIDNKRLEAIPWAQLCINCAQKKRVRR